LVTGASRGIGKAAALALAKIGAVVAVNYRTRVQEADAVSREIQDMGGYAVALQADVSIAADVHRMVQQVEEQIGPVAVLVNNAGITRPQPIHEITEQGWDEVLAVNLKSVFLVTQAVLPGMRAALWGRIINLSSVAAQTGGVIGPHYAASKAGILGLTHSYAALLAKEGITVNAIAPALIETDMVRDNPRARPDLIPTGRFGTVDEVADVVVMLATNGYITGQTINVNGGWYMSYLAQPIPTQTQDELRHFLESLPLGPFGSSTAWTGGRRTGECPGSRHPGSWPAVGR
jgi:3-oxoacyl-[acyl-carrier protein] reductase